jgi:hypothetical protein
MLHFGGLYVLGLTLFVTAEEDGVTLATSLEEPSWVHPLEESCPSSGYADPRQDDIGCNTLQEQTTIDSCKNACSSGGLHGGQSSIYDDVMVLLFNCIPCGAASLGHC